ncbi:methyl-accepting chemotaxis protein [Eubacteriaceae bacterium ES3]|nr:methyl-accepting chemotaxis protein [Eubacteriaceae bacterium ES3]
MEKDFKLGMRLTTKLILMTVLILIAAATVMGFFSVSRGTSIIETENAQDADDFVSESANHIGAIIESHFGVLNEVAQRDSVISMDFETQSAALADDISRLELENIAIMDMNGHAKYIAEGGEFDAAGQSCFEDGLAGNLCISDVVEDPVTGEPSIFEVVPIKNNNQVVGLLVARRDPTFMTDVVSALGDGENQYALVMSANGVLMAHPNAELVMQKLNIYETAHSENETDLALGFVLQDMDLSQVASIYYEKYGEPKIGHIAPVPGTTWTLVISESQEFMLQPINDLKKGIILIAFSTVLGGAAIALFVSRMIAKPVIAANDMIKELDLGHLSKRVEITTRDEVGEMSASLNHMAGNLQSNVVGLMQQIANGDVSAELEIIDTEDEITPALKTTVETIRGLIAEAASLSEAAKAGKWETRGDAEAFAGGFKEIVQGVNETLDIVVDQMVWYEGILDSLPFPINVTDNNMKWTFMNRAFEAFLAGNSDIKDRESAIGMDCWNAGSDICQTENCGIRQLVDHNKSESFFDYKGSNNKQTTAYLKNKKGENIGFVETITDLTEIMRVSNYTSAEVSRLASNLSLLAQGNIDFDLNLTEADEYTTEISTQFEKIRDNMSEVKNSVEHLINDATMMALAGIQGQLDTRADASSHQGQFSEIVVGLNGIMDAVVGPVKEASATLKELSQGNLNTEMSGFYNGDYVQIKDDMNQTISFLKSYVTEITSTLTEIGHGNLDLEITADYLGDFRAIKDALNAITTELSATLSTIGDASNQVEAGANQISDGGQALSQGASEQAAAIQELNASMDEVANDTSRNATNANQANALSSDVKNSAEAGNSQMDEMVGAMNDINESSNNISKIIRVIDDIAFQTNILALNAAVEAARAGQHGKGFAVVAEEVRTLAARSAEAARETTELIEGSINKVEAGTAIATDTAESLKGILAKIESMTSLVGEIANASNAQATKINEINTGIEQVAKVVQTNSATAEESAAASEELLGQAELLKSRVYAFKLKKGGSSSYQAPAAKLAPSQPTEDVSIELDDFDMNSFNDFNSDKY